MFQAEDSSEHNLVLKFMQIGHSEAVVMMIVDENDNQLLNQNDSILQKKAFFDTSSSVRRFKSPLFKTLKRSVQFILN